MSDSDIKVSVCVITYKQENYIRKCLDSIFAQKTNFNFEVIVGEDASPDNTREILLEYKEKYGDKLVLVLHDENVGVSKNGLSVREKVRGEYVSTCEGDDYWTDENKLQKQFDILEAHPEYSAVASDYMIVSPEGKIIEPKNLYLKKDIIKSMKNWLSKIFPINEERYQKLRTVAPTMGDIISYTLLYDYGDIYVLKDVMSAHRMAGKNDTASFSYNASKKAIEHSWMYYNIVKALEEYLDSKYDLTPLFVNRLTAVKLLKLIQKFSYKKEEFKELFDKLSFKYKFMFYIRLIRKFIRKFTKKIRRKLA